MDLLEGETMKLPSSIKLLSGKINIPAQIS